MDLFAIGRFCGFWDYTQLPERFYLVYRHITSPRSTSCITLAIGLRTGMWLTPTTPKSHFCFHRIDVTFSQ